MLSNTSAGRSFDGIDNDCDGLIDEVEDMEAPLIDMATGVCSAVQKVCAGADGWIEPLMSDVAGYEAEELTCDGLDNDCDGLVDEGLDAPLAQNQQGVCGGARSVSVELRVGLNRTTQPLLNLRQLRRSVTVLITTAMVSQMKTLVRRWPRNKKAFVRGLPKSVMARVVGRSLATRGDGLSTRRNLVRWFGQRLRWHGRRALWSERCLLLHGPGRYCGADTWRELWRRSVRRGSRDLWRFTVTHLLD